MSTTITYKGSTLTTVNNQTRTLKTAGKYMEGDVVLTDVSSADIPTFIVIYNDDECTSLNSITCNKTYSECVNLFQNNGKTGAIVEIQAPSYTVIGTAEYCGSGNNYIYYEQVNSNHATRRHIDYYSNNTISITGTGLNPYWNVSKLTVTSNGTYNDVNTYYNTVTVNVSSSSPTIQSLTVTPTTSQQTFNASGVDGYKPVTVAAMPTMTLPTSAASSATSGYTSKATIGRSTAAQYINIPPGYNSAGAYYVISAVANGSATGPTSLSGSSATITTGTNTITLTKTGVSTTPTVSAGYVSSATTSTATVALTASVTVNPTPTASGATVTIPAGYYSSQTTKSVTSGSATAPSSISGTAASVSTGTNTLTLTKTVSVTPTVSAGYVSSGTAGNSSVSLTASVTTKAAATITPTTTNQTIAAGTYLTGTQTIAGDADLVGSNILSTANIFGVQGTVDFIDVYIRSTAPTSSVGSDGDIYIQE